MSRTPIPTTGGITAAVNRHGRRPIPMTPTKATIWTMRRIASGQYTDPCDSLEMMTLNSPIATPARSPKRRPDGPSLSSPDRETRRTAAIATTIPIVTGGGGRPWRTIPTPTGTSTAKTPVTGATTPIRPTARPWYRPAIPTDPAAPASADRPTSTGAGAASPRTTATAIAATSPTTCDRTRIPNRDARRVVRPPAKSETPHDSVASRPNTTTAAPGGRSGGSTITAGGPGDGQSPTPAGSAGVQSSDVT